MPANATKMPRKHACDVDKRRAYAIRVLSSIEDTLQVHMYWINVQGLRVKAFVVCCFLLMFVDYRIVLSFRFLWALLACLRWSLGTLGLLWVPLDGHWGSICHLWGSIGAPLWRHWAPFFRLWESIGAPLGVIGGHFGGHFAIILVHFDFLIFVIIEGHWGPLGFFSEKARHEASQV